MKIIKKEYVKYLEWAFKLSYLLLGIATFNSFLYDSPVQPMLVKLCLILGILAILGRVVYFKDYIKTPYLLLLILFCISFCISIAVNWKYGTAVANLKWVVWTGFLFFLLYACDTTRDRMEYKKEFTLFANIIVVISVLNATASLYLMVNLYHNLWHTASGEALIAGFQWGRLWGVYTDPNYGAVFSTIAVLLSAYFVKTGKGMWKLLYLAAIVVDYIYILFSDSRTAEVCMCVGAGIFLLFLFFQKQANWKGILAGILAAVVFAGVFVGVTSAAKAEYNTKIEAEIKKADAEKESQEKKNEQKKTQESTTTAQKTEQKVGRSQDLQSDISNGRFELWASGLEVWKTKPITGTGYNSFLPYVREAIPDTYVVNNDQGEYVSLHNGYINILVYQGLLGAVLFASFMICVMVKWCKGVKAACKDHMDDIAVLTACVSVVAVSMVFLLEGVYTNSPGVFVLWTFLGYLMHYFVKKEEHSG